MELYLKAFISTSLFPGMRAFPGGSMVKNPPKQETQVQSLGWENPLEEEMATHSSISAEKSHGQRSLEDCHPRGGKELDTT